MVMTLLVRIQRKERHAATLLFTSRPWRDAGLPQRRPRSGRLSGEASREEAGDSCSPAWRRAEDGISVPGRAASDRRTPSFSLLEERMKESRRPGAQSPPSHERGRPRCLPFRSGDGALAAAAPSPSLRLPALTGETRASSRDTPGPAFWAPAARRPLLSRQAPSRTHGLAPGPERRRRVLPASRRPPRPGSCQQRRSRRVMRLSPRTLGTRVLRSRGP